MIFIYATDLHGDSTKYSTILEFAIKYNIKLIHLGADILPKGSEILSIQKSFISGFLKRFYSQAAEAGIKILASFGNDDIYTRKKYFLKYAELLDETPYSQEGYDFSAYNYVPVYPFPLKTACKLDYKGWQPEEYTGRNVDVSPDLGIIPILDLDLYLAEKGTIEDDLKNLKCSEKTIVAFHCPPANVDLDVCVLNLEPREIKKVGSKAIYDWLLKNQPKICLCGHIHESYFATGVFKAYIGKTLVIQPGQMKKTQFVVIDVNEQGIQVKFEES